MTSAIPHDDLHVAEVEMYEVLVAARSRSEPVGPGAGEPIGPAPCLDLVRHIASPVPLQRRLGAALVEARARVGRLDDDEARTLAAVLAWAVEVETTAARPVLLSAALVLADRVG